jgi:hypothetical protein
MAGFLNEDEMENVLANNLMDDAWTKGATAQSILYKEAEFDGGDMAAQLNARSTGSKKITANLPVGQYEMIATNTLEAFYTVGLSINGSTKWVMATDANTRPPGVDASYTLVKPKGAATTAVSYNGVRPGTYCLQSQLNKLTVQNMEFGPIVDSLLDSNNLTNGPLVQHAIIDGYCNAMGIVDCDPTTVNDIRVMMPDQFGKILCPLDTSVTPPVQNETNAFIDARRIKKGDAGVTLSERLYHRLLNGGSYNKLFSSQKTSVACLRTLPPGCPVKLTFEVLDGTDRLNTGVIAQYSTDNGTTWVDGTFTINFESVVLRFQAIALNESQFQQYRSGHVLGAPTPIVFEKSPKSAHLDRARAARYTVTDLACQYQQVATGQSSATMTVNTSNSDTLPPFMMVFLTKVDGADAAFSTAALWSSNWDCLNWTYPLFKSVRASTSSGGSQRPPFYDMYPNNDINMQDPYELSLMCNNVSGQMFFSQVDNPSKSSLMAQQQVVAYNTWLLNGKYPPNRMPGRNAACWYTDPSSAIIKDAAEGHETSSLTLTVTFKEALTASYALMVARFCRADVCIDVLPQADLPDVQSKYTFDPLTTGYAFTTVDTKDR